MLQLAREQRRQGHEVTIFTTNLDYPSGRMRGSPSVVKEDAGVSIRCFSAHLHSLALSLPLFRALVRETHRFDIVHIHGLYRFPQLIAGLTARKAGIPYLVQPHGTLDLVVFQKSIRSIKAKLAYTRLFGFPLLRNASAIYYTSDQEKNRGDFLHLNDSTFVLPNGLDTKQFANRPTRGSFRIKYSLENRPMILFAGRINFKKGLDVLVSAFSKIVNQYQDAILVLAGPDNEGYGDYIRAIARTMNIGEQQLIFTGMLQMRELLEAYVDADVFVLPSYGENFGLTVVEAMACGCPVIVSDKVGIAGDIRGAGAGLVAAHNPNQVSRALLSILGNHGIGKQMGEAGMRLVNNKYDVSRVVMELTRQYQLVIQKAC